MIKYILIILLASCTTVPDAIVPPKEKVVHIDPRIMEPCEPLSRLPEPASFEDILSVTVANFEKYVNCATKQHNSAILLRKFSNKEE